MKVRSIAVSECKSGLILAEKVKNRYGAAFVTENTVLNDYIIQKLSELGIESICVYDDHKGRRESDASRAMLQFKRSYSDGVIAIKSMVNDLAAGKPLDIKNVDQISDLIFNEMNKNSYIAKCLIEERKADEYTYTHSLNVAFYAMLTGKWLSLGKSGIQKVIKAGLLHDIGKTRVPIEILNKKARLSAEEFDEIKRHAAYGHKILESADSIPAEVREAVLQHHEREDKSGYPYGVDGRQIGMCAKIVAVSDVYDAMTSDRVYKKRATPFEVFEMFQTTGISGFDPKVVNTFISNISTHYIGSKVVLNTGQLGEIMYIPPHNPAEPVISIGAEFIDISQSKDHRILYLL